MIDCKVINTDGLLFLCMWADQTRQNRRANTEHLAETLDPEGVHLLNRVLAFHNDTNVDRVEVFAKRKETLEPARFWLDVPHDRYERLFDAEDIYKFGKQATSGEVEA